MAAIDYLGVRINAEYVLVSTTIPALFPAVEVLNAPRPQPAA
ncbi:hypothetical protein [Rhodococcus sp. HM1]|nr:hypothetical protein [Rhodococcus sp. HM1]